MNNIILSVFVIPAFTLTAQQFEIPVKDHPYYDIIEWKGMGGLLMSKDPEGNTKQINLTLIGNQQSSIWDQKFNPKGEEFYYLASENARYVYFMDNLELNNGKFYFSQLNSAGNVKSISVSVSSVIKSLGNYDHNELELINIVVTDKALVHHYRYDDKKSKSVREFATFMTHHNFRIYAVELGEVTYATLKENDHYGQWQYIGFTGEEIYFAARDFQNKSTGWSVKGFTSKASPLMGYFINAPAVKSIPIENIGFGTTGSYYLGKQTTREVGLLSYINGNFYLTNAQHRDQGAELVLYTLEEAKWSEVNSMNLNYFIEKKELKLGIYPMNEGIGYHLDHNGYNKVSLLSFIPNQSHAHNEFSGRTIFNPSSVFYPKEKEEFPVNLPEVVLMFDTKQLERPGALKFELKEKE